MKKSILLLFVLAFLSCTSTKTVETQNWINSQNFTIIKPSNWRSVKHHGYVGYTPLKNGTNFYNNVVSVFQFQLKDKPEFKKIVFDQIKKSNEVLNPTSQVVLIENNHFGEAYVHKYESTWNGIKYKKYVMNFQYKGEYYNYTYSSILEKYDKHFKEAISILNSIKFK
ncbi:hypothetical protein [Tenacibaculum sp. 1_MG-2023]|uniref:hypothetical protein n=1 Tax=Tenacibaculum sp. 1_MG-2023 TaxID=3062653 RepID=UPI0026E22020|nr:hypothetical protein [Tenacibaculum sp. 1_MG-2023]MDO6600305.1 hypothetical protein [Tenacibaculum sp. 1_MG-2023]